MHLGYLCILGRVVKVLCTRPSCDGTFLIVLVVNSTEYSYTRSSIFRSSRIKLGISYFEVGKSAFLKACFSPKFSSKIVDIPSLSPPVSYSICSALLCVVPFSSFPPPKNCFLRSKGTHSKFEFRKTLIKKKQEHVSRICRRKKQELFHQEVVEESIRHKARTNIHKSTTISRRGTSKAWP